MTRANCTLNSTHKIKTLADVRPIAIDDADSIIRSFHLHLCANNAGHAVQNGKALPNGEKAINGEKVLNGEGILNGNGA